LPAGLIAALHLRSALPDSAPLPVVDETQAAAYNGMIGHTYAFYSVATNHISHRQSTPSGAQASTTTRAFIYLPKVMRKE
jgi:hypothetical protein